MKNSELKDHLIGACENLVELDRQLGELSASVVAMRQALGEVSPDRFEAAFQRHLTGPLSDEIRRAHELGRNVLLAIIETLKQSV